jgi:hypothetical protein
MSLLAPDGPEILGFGTRGRYLWLVDSDPALESSGRIHGVIVTPASRPSGLRRRVTTWPHGSVRSATTGV